MKKTLLLLVILNISYFTLQAQPYTISTLAGTGTDGYNGDGGSATAAQLFSPFGVQVDKAGNVYIGDTYNNRIRMVNTSGIITTIAGNGYGTWSSGGYSGDGGPATAAELGSPCGIAIDEIGNIFFADWVNNCIRKINTSGIISTYAGVGYRSYSGDGGQATLAGLCLPTDVATDSAGNVYIADYGNNCIRKVNTSGIITTIAGNAYEAGTDAGAYSGDGGPATDAELNLPEGVAVDKTGNVVYIVDSYNDRIREVTSNGVINTIAGSGIAGYAGDGGAATLAKLSAPFGIALDSHGDIFISDDSNACIREINTSGVIYTVAGTTVAGYSGDGGAATAAEMNAAGLIATDALGNIYLGDRYNNRTRKLTNLTASVNQIKAAVEEVNIFPNPSNGVFTLNTENLKVNSTIEVYNMLGEKIYSNEFSTLNSPFSINLSGNPSGIYLYKIITETGEQVCTGKLIIAN